MNESRAGGPPLSDADLEMLLKQPGRRDPRRERVLRNVLEVVSEARPAVERSPADGLTLLVAPDATFTANPALFSKLIYDPNGFTPISVLCRGTPMLPRCSW